MIGTAVGAPRLPAWWGDVNVAIVVTGPGARDWGAMAVNRMPDVGFLPCGQCFPLLRYLRDGYSAEWNIMPRVQSGFRRRYGRGVPADVFAYVYGVMLHPDYARRWASSLRRELPRIPFVADAGAGRAIMEAGHELITLHVNYDRPSPPTADVQVDGPADDWRIPRGGMRVKEDGDGALSVQINRGFAVTGIPRAAGEWTIAGRHSLQWFVANYRHGRDRQRPNNPNDAFAGPGALVAAIARVAGVAAATADIRRALPALEPDVGIALDMTTSP